MASNETIAEIVREMRGPYYKMGRSNASLDKQMMDYMSFIANRIEAAHKRERKAGAEAAQICGEIGEMIGREAAGRQPVTDCNRLGNVAKDDERLTIVANYETIIADKDAEIAELERRLKAAEKFATEMKQTMNSLVRACAHQIILRLQGEGGNDEK